MELARPQVSTAFRSLPAIVHKKQILFKFFFIEHPNVIGSKLAKMFRWDINLRYFFVTKRRAGFSSNFMYGVADDCTYSRHKATPILVRWGECWQGGGGVR